MPSVTSESAVDRLFQYEDVFDFSPEARATFIAAMREMIAFHRQHSPLYEGLCRLDGFTEADLKTEDDLQRIPHIIVTAFKEQKILTLPESEIVATFTSSGTSGSMSQTNLDAISKDRQSAMRANIVKSYGLVDDQPVNYLCFSYDPASGGKRGAAHTHSVYATFAPSNETFYAITQGDDGEPHFRLDACVETIERYAKSGLPLRVTGFPAFGWVTLSKLDELGLRFQFPPNSLLFSGGGWKLHTGKPVPFDEYVALVQRVLGISRDRIRDVYGMVEHGVPYLTCEKGHFHVPIYGRVWAVDPGTEEILPYGEVGLYKLITPYIRSVPCISVLSTDLGEVRERCECGRNGPILVLHGRGGVKKYDGCAISAAQLLGQ